MPVISWYVGDRRECKQANENGECLCVAFVTAVHFFRSSLNDYDTKHNDNNRRCYDHADYYTRTNVEHALQPGSELA